MSKAKEFLILKGVDQENIEAIENGSILTIKLEDLLESYVSYQICNHEYGSFLKSSSNQIEHFKCNRCRTKIPIKEYNSLKGAKY